MFDKPTANIQPTLMMGTGVLALMPAYADIPQEFKSFNSRNPYVKFQEKWFFEGVSEKDIPAPKDGIDKNEALRHLATIQRSFQPKHEHKSAAVAFLMSKWFNEPKV